MPASQALRDIESEPAHDADIGLHVGVPLDRPPMYAKVLTGFFFIAPWVALLILVLRHGPFPWKAAGLTLGMIVVLGHGVTVGFHRLFAHRSYVAVRPLKIALGVLGTLAFQGSVIGWVADHRRHHRFSDRPGDPHSPIWKGSTRLHGIRGLWHAHVGWCFTVDPTDRAEYASDLLADRDLVLIDRLFVPIAIGTFALPFGAGLLWGGWSGAWTAFLCAGFVRVGITLQGTWSVNSVCHRFGRRPFATSDRSTNFAPLAIITMGEAWHNNHHAFPRSARHGLLPGQVDSSARVIRWLERMGWATDVRWPDATRVANRLAAASAHDVDALIAENGPGLDCPSRGTDHPSAEELHDGGVALHH